MKKLFLVTLIILTSFSSNSIAHQDHGAMLEVVNITQEQAIVIATNKVTEQIKYKKLDSSWDSVKSKTAVLERDNGRQVWKISFSQVNDNTTNILDVVLSKTGGFISISNSK